MGTPPPRRGPLDYDRAGRLTSVNAAGGTNTYSYNDRGALLSTAGPSGAASFGFDDDGRLTTRTDLTGTATFGYVKGGDIAAAGERAEAVIDWGVMLLTLTKGESLRNLRRVL